MLTFEDAAPYLFERNLIDPAWVIDGSLTIQSLSSRNGNLKIEGPDGAGLLLKQPADQAETGAEGLRAEAAFYRFCEEEPEAAALKRIVPRVAYHDAERSLLAVRLIPNALTLSRFFNTAGQQRFPIEAAAALGRALATVHRTFDHLKLGQSDRLSWLSRQPPSMLEIHRPTADLLSSLSPANVKLIRMLQSEDATAEHLDSLRARWRVETVIHGDIRPANVLVAPGLAESPRDVWLVDWEMVQLGDPAWDLAGALQCFAKSWVDSMPMEANLSIDERAERARFPLGFVHALSCSLWHAYECTVDYDQSASDALLDRAVTLSAVRMIQTAYEISSELMELDPRSVILLQLGTNSLARSGVARTQLFGIQMRAPLQ